MYTWTVRFNPPKLIFSVNENFLLMFASSFCAQSEQRTLQTKTINHIYLARANMIIVIAGWRKGYILVIFMVINIMKCYSEKKLRYC